MGHYHFDDTLATVDSEGKEVPAKSDASNVILGLRMRDGIKKLYKSVEDILVMLKLADRPE